MFVSSVISKCTSVVGDQILLLDSDLLNESQANYIHKLSSKLRSVNVHLKSHYLEGEQISCRSGFLYNCSLCFLRSGRFPIVGQSSCARPNSVKNCDCLPLP